MEYNPATAAGEGVKTRSKIVLYSPVEAVNFLPYNRAICYHLTNVNNRVCITYLPPASAICINDTPETLGKFR